MLRRIGLKRFIERASFEEKHGFFSHQIDMKIYQYEQRAVSSGAT